LAKPKVQLIPFETICLILHAWWIVQGLCNVLVGDLEFVLIVLERSPPHLFLYLFLFDKEKQKRKQTRALPVETLRSLNFIIFIIIIIKFKLKYFLFYLYVFTQLFII
jgi:hypothetical protein